MCQPDGSRHLSLIQTAELMSDHSHDLVGGFRDRQVLIAK